MNIRIGTRGSILAIAQTLEIKNLLNRYFPEISVQIVKIKTSGDINNQVPLSAIGGKSLFIKEIEEALLMGKVDLAVHSVKDIPAFYCEGLIIPCVLKRNSPYDVFISSKHKDIKSLPLNATIGTSSVRRKVQLNYLRPDLQVVPVRGNIDTRILKANVGEFDGIVLAEAGLIRINRCDVIKEILSPKIMLSAVGQGAIGIQCRVDDHSIINKIKVLNCHQSYVCVMAERSFLKTINGSCDTPLAALAQYVNNDTIHMSCMLANEKNMVFASCCFNECDAEKSGINMGKKLMDELSQSY
ncbi:porphobilinogen deaminase [Ehrlichia chaffeensis str. Liberty]|uniref:hydroxymethylbilane synthase n=1 Tax=Ehrlichia chaffeensis TaxID=945 RepID=UPI000444D659|nr:hydroxymethylbilane synthase [Ehrlichia chaffeensis]AHX06493.1 porphobilinogen deaminase [Ehrlichia chaffeensis str. Liberty]